ncbi:hypothetical protein NM208_g3937 [Fusarium decemcellulare]|uniref:Uncharacterized protein n=1 Tax=Fusarium decemcellulare TaxID=57161 RepID=A0ACC1SMH0_9HYPO|nr:hypothetical protein NM208_g3937 [Fusarium decemcellulare]
MLVKLFHVLAVLASSALCSNAKGHSKLPNIVFLLTDDQDERLSSTKHQPVLNKEIIDKGTYFRNHHVTTAVCCPSRATLLKGQLAHNTNITHVRSPGGDYEKWVIAGNDIEYMPHYMKKAGYRTEYVGKLLNGYSLFNYDIRPKGWDHTDCLMDPYNAAFNQVVMSRNGEWPVTYPGYHQADVMRAKMMDLLEHLAAQDDPWLLFLAPTMPHVDNGLQYVEPPIRYWDAFANLSAPRLPNWNPKQEYQDQKSYWMKTLEPMNESMIEFSDMSYRRRIQSLQGVDEMIEDAVAYLEERGLMDNTYFIYTSDNGYHTGQFRQASGKSTPYGEDSNVPLVVRGPGIPEGATSTLPSTHTDFIPTLLDIAGIGPADWPALLDGRSLLNQWKHPSKKDSDSSLGNAKETINIEHWGFGTIEAPAPKRFFPTSTYKAIRLAGEANGWLYVVWCTGEVELYDTIDDPYGLVNLANSTTTYHQRVLGRLNAILLHMKSCSSNSCRDPWAQLTPPSAKEPIKNFKQAMNAQYDDFFSSFPQFKFGKCMDYQYAPNETPFYPPESESLGREWRGPTDGYSLVLPKQWVEKNDPLAGTWEQRRETWGTIKKSERALTPYEIYGKNLTERNLDFAFAMDLVEDANGS